jgi:hypothetical protein
VKWRELQIIFMVALQTTALLPSEPQPVEDEILLFPSYFSESDRTKLGLTQLAIQEADLREGQASECILRLCYIVKTISALHNQRRTEDQGQRANTRSRAKIGTLDNHRNRTLSNYEMTRNALVSLGRSSNQFPHLTLQDLNRKSTHHKRSANDTHRTDGKLWGLGESHTSHSQSTNSDSSKKY